MQSGSEKLADALEAIRGLAARREVGKAIREELEELADSIDPVRKRIAEIEGLYGIDFGSEVDEKIGDAAKLWQASAPGPIKAKQLSEIRQLSPLLSTLYVKGLDIQRAYKFDPLEKEIATWFGTHIDMLSDLLRSFRREQQSKEGHEWKILVPMSHGLKEALELLNKKEVIRTRKILTRNKEKRWVPIKPDWLRDDPGTQVLLIYEKRNSSLFNLLQGIWLNSYVNDIIDDQLVRHGVPFELYTQVVYKAPQDVIRTVSDFDVIGRFRDTVICVECKSGKLDARRGHFEEIIQRTEDVRKVLHSMGTGEVSFLFFVVYDPELNSEEEMRTQLESRDIRPLRPNEVRSVMARALEASLA